MKRNLYEIEVTNNKKVNSSYFFKCTERQIFNLFHALAFASNESDIVYCSLWIVDSFNERNIVETFSRSRNVHHA